MKQRYTTTHAALAAVLVASVAPGLAKAQPAAQNIRPLTVLADEAARRQAGPATVAVNLETLATLRTNDGITLPLTEGVERAAAVRRIERRAPGRYSLFGRFDGDEDGFFVITVEGNAVVGLFETPWDGAYQLHHLDTGLAQVAWIDRAGFAKCALPSDSGPAAAPAQQPAAPAQPSALPSPNGDDAPGEDSEEFTLRGGCSSQPRNFDVIIAYTQDARDEAGGTDAIKAVAQLAVDTTNQVYDDSQINAQVTLVFTKQVPYVESNDIYDDRDALTDPSDNQLDALHDDRDEFGADFVCLLVDNSDPSACGVAHCTPSGPEEGFCVVQQSCAVGNFSFAHELGHLQGCAHNKEDTGAGCNDSCYSYGNRFIGTSGGAFRTVMAYNNDTEAYTRIGKFSNPNVNHDGVPTGFDCPLLGKGTNNAQTIDDTAANRESWRSPKLNVWVDDGALAPWVGTPQAPWPTVALGVAVMYNGAREPATQPTLHVKTGAYDETLTISTPMTIAPCGGSVTIGRS